MIKYRVAGDDIHYKFMVDRHFISPRQSMEEHGNWMHLRLLKTSAEMSAMGS